MQGVLQRNNQAASESVLNQPAEPIQKDILFSWKIGLRFIIYTKIWK